jgi:hypothetical protein
MKRRGSTSIGCLALSLAMSLPANAQVTESDSSRVSAQETAPEVSLVEGKKWEQDQPIPPGYHPARKRALGIVGVSLLGGGYALSALTGLGLLASCQVASDNSCHSSISDTSAAWFLLPIVGPFVALTRSDIQKDGGAVFWSATFGAMQVVGAGLLVYYVNNPKYTLQRNDEASLELVPLIGQHAQGLLLNARF